VRETNKPRALVTGGAVRLGRAIALSLAGAGMDVAIGYYRAAAEAKRTVRDLQAHGGRAIALRADLRDARGAGRLVQSAARAFGGLDVLVNSAAVFARTPFERVTPAQYDEILAVNTRAALFCAQAAARVMRRAPGPRSVPFRDPVAAARACGHIVNIGDAAIIRAMPAFLPYAMSKAALTALTAGLAAALAAERIAVNAVAPGPVLRPRGYPIARWNRLTRGRPMRLDDVTAAVVFLATCPAAITGTTVTIDG
jgi:NAD(P)-dependent dehydrogenase (short-subunit alcohol dehydrogenase family)